MKKSMKISLIVAMALIAVGALLGGTAFALGGRFEYDNPHTETRPADGTFDSVAVYVSAPEVTIRASDDGSAYAVCEETDHISYDLTVTNGVLTLREKDERKWYHYVGIYFGDREITLYLPADTYASLTVSSTGGDITCTDQGLSFVDVSLSTASGEIEFSSPTSGYLNVATASGDVDLSNCRPTDLSVVSASGEIDLSNIITTGTCSVDTSSGELDMVNVRAKTLIATSNSGDITLRDVVVSQKLTAKTFSGDIQLTKCDGGEILLKSSSGSIDGSLLSDKDFDADSSSGDIHIPDSVKNSGKCTVRTSSGDIRLRVID